MGVSLEKRVGRFGLRKLYRQKNSPLACDQRAAHQMTLFLGNQRL
jgi:hypothetical protein